MPGIQDATMCTFRSGTLSITRVRQFALVRWTPVGVGLKGQLVYGRSWEDEFLIPQPYNQAAALTVMEVAAHARLGMLKGLQGDDQ